MNPFKAYDIRGIYGPELNEELAYKIGRILPSLLGGNSALVGRDARSSSPSLAESLISGLLDSGCNVDDIGLSSTPMVYFFTAEGGYDFSIQITASHNPANYNGFKISKRGSLPVGYDTGLADLERLCASPLPPPASICGNLNHRNVLPDFLAFLKPFIPDLSGLRLVVDCSNGMASLSAHTLFEASGAKVTFLADSPNGNFPCHPPNPLEAAARMPLIHAVQDLHADLGIIFDGDADRVMFVDENGTFIPPDLLIAVIAPFFLRKYKNAIILHDIRTSRGVTESLSTAGATPFIWKVGHAFAKRKLRELNAPFGGEFAGHYYFRDFHWCDSGELAALIALHEIAIAHRSGIPFSQMIAPICPYANSGEVNFRIKDKDAAILRVISFLEQNYGKPSRRLDFDGFRLDYPDWWISLRKSNTEPFLRLMLEASSPSLLASLKKQVSSLISPDSHEPHFFSPTK